MYPGIALFYPKLARAVLEYRVRTRDGAKDNAQKQGYKVLESLHPTIIALLPSLTCMKVDSYCTEGAKHTSNVG